MHGVSVLAEPGHYGEAAEATSGLSIRQDWPKSRMSHHFAEIASAQDVDQPA
ncbi:hypothetical protein [Streptomyces sp. NBC_00151]|uniref:hypothetical protein n=1 Tax=Streptomyces sp. NBC_00151 TaxID=2975669 RepID=UPI002DDAFEC3|nr:hypothetical protein [Streptomyces sp. NBC_00151]WRZ36696.1 hypothetical protein OG915_00440 [Streptomyces sp. NBC_00151]WRZ44880.1 hypothetical protein OG915_47115 [Streptomyces sp. NBC_00151]